MKKLFFLGLLLSLFVVCGPRQDKIERFIENGVEVVVNHLQPYKVGGEPSHLMMEEEVRIDLERGNLEQFGIKRPEFAEADSGGNIYVAESYGAEYFIYKFDGTGRYIKRFGRAGQGPGEIQRISGIQIDNQDKLLVSDIGNKKVVKFDKEGAFIGEVHIKSGMWVTTPLENGNHLGLRNSAAGWDLLVLDSNFGPVKKVDFYDLSEFRKGKTTGTVASFHWRVAHGKIYVGNEQRGYEICVFDLEGDLLRKIRKEYRPAEYPKEFKEQTRQNNLHLLQNGDPGWIVMDHTPPFNSFFIDDESRLYVMTYEKGEGEDEYIHDISSV